MNKLYKYNPKSLSEEIISIAEKKNRDGEKFYIAISGGRSVIGVLEELSSTDTDFSNWNFIIVDERNVPLDSNESNTKQLSSYIYKANIISFYNSGLIDLEESIRSYRNIEKIDYALMGVGEDGHFASLFPGKKVDSKEVMLVNDSPKPPAKRITVTFNFFKKCQIAIFLVIGEGKHHVLDSRENLPFMQLEKYCETKVYTDKE